MQNDLQLNLLGTCCHFKEPDNMLVF